MAIDGIGTYYNTFLTGYAGKGLFTEVDELINIYDKKIRRSNELICMRVVDVKYKQWSLCLRFLIALFMIKKKPSFSQLLP